METQELIEQRNVSRASALLVALSSAGLLIIALAGEDELQPVAVALIASLLPAMIAIPLVLATGPARPTILSMGRRLVWLQAVGLLAAGVIGIAITAV